MIRVLLVEKLLSNSRILRRISVELAIVHEDGILYIFDNKDPLENHLVIEKTKKLVYYGEI